MIIAPAIGRESYGAAEENANTLSYGEEICLELRESLIYIITTSAESIKPRQPTKAFMIMFEKAPKPPVGSALVNDIKVTAHTIGSLNASTVARSGMRMGRSADCDGLETYRLDTSRMNYNSERSRGN